jgi:hypothetical protein
VLLQGRPAPKVAWDTPPRKAGLFSFSIKAAPAGPARAVLRASANRASLSDARLESQRQDHESKTCFEVFRSSTHLGDPNGDCSPLLGLSPRSMCQEYSKA